MTLNPQTLGKPCLNNLCFFTSPYRIEPLIKSRAKTQTKFLNKTITLVPFFMLPETSLRRMTTLTNIKTRKTHINIWITTPKLTRLQNCIIKQDNINIILHKPIYYNTYE